MLADMEKAQVDSRARRKPYRSYFSQEGEHIIRESMYNNLNYIIDY